MENQKETICPWCQTEIVWDPEIGPEETCPHCWNELGDYRSVNLSVQSSDDEEPEKEPDDQPEDEAEDIFWEGETDDRYGEAVQQCLDEQEEAPECSSCHEFMLLAGQQTALGDAFASSEPVALGGPFLKAPFTVNVYVCPSCFRVEYSLEGKDRMAMIDRISQQPNT